MTFAGKADLAAHPSDDPDSASTASNTLPGPAALQDAFGDVGAGSKPTLESAEAEAPVSITPSQLRALHLLQGQAHRFISGYLVFQDVRDRCLEARAFAEEESGRPPQDLREKVQKFRDAYDKRQPRDLDHELADLAELENELTALRTAFTSATSPFRSQRADPLEFANLVAVHLTNAEYAISRVLGACHQRGLDALRDLTVEVESIVGAYIQAEEARRRAAAAAQQSFKRASWVASASEQISETQAFNANAGVKVPAKAGQNGDTRK